MVWPYFETKTWNIAAQLFAWYSGNIQEIWRQCACNLGTRYANIICQPVRIFSRRGEEEREGGLHDVVCGTNMWLSEIITGIRTCTTELCHTNTPTKISFISRIFLKMCDHWPNDEDNTSKFLLLHHFNLANRLFYTFLTIIWLIYHCTYFQTSI